MGAGCFLFIVKMSAQVLDYLAPTPLCERGTSFVLGADPKGKKILYCVGKIVVIRDIENPAKSDIYSEHVHNVKVAKYAPNGNYIASGDITGAVKRWEIFKTDPLQKPEFKTKQEDLRPFAGEIRDLCWGPESKRIAVCGQGSTKHAACVTWDSGNNLGEIEDHDKRANSIDLKPNRPYRLIVGDDTFQTVLYHGPPFKSTLNINDHIRFVNVVRFSPDGKYFATGSSDANVFLYDGKTGEKCGQFIDGKTSHGGGIYALSWSPDSKEILTVSGDKSAKIWNVETKESVMKFVMGKDMLDQLTGCAWVGNTLITLSLSGNFTYLDRNDPEHPLKVIYGHTRALSSIVAIPSDKPCHVSADITGKMLWWDTDAGVAHPFLGIGHTNKVVGVCYDSDSKKVISAGWDDTVRFTCTSDFDFSNGTCISLDGQPRIIVLAGKYVVVLTSKGLLLIKDEKIVHETKHAPDFEPKLLAASGSDIIIEHEQKKMKILHIENDRIVESGKEISVETTPTAVCFSPDGSSIAIAGTDKSIKIFSTVDDYRLLKECYIHSNNATKLQWSPNNQHVFSSSIDGMLGCWNIATDKRKKILRAHEGSFVCDMSLATDEILLTAGDNGVTQVWKITW